MSARSDLEEIHAIRRRLVAEGKWPRHSLATWHELATAAAERYHQGHAPTPVERRALELFPELLDDAVAA